MGKASPSTKSDAKRVLVTGGSGGIGRGVCLAFARHGWEVGVHYLTRREEAIKTVEQMAAYSTAGRLYHADIRVLPQVHGMVADFIAHHGGLDVFVCNAGAAATHLLLRHPVPEWQRIIETNLTGTFHCLQAAGQCMVGSGGGAIIVIGSYAGMQGSTGQAAYATAKAGLLGLVKTAAREWGQFNIRVNLVFPGWQHTAMTSDTTPPSEFWDQHCLGRAPSLKEVARTVYFMAQSQDLSGQVWNLDSRLL